jgi:hypothetical protein
METMDAVNADFRAPFDELGRLDEDDFNGYKTLHIGGVLGVCTRRQTWSSIPGFWLQQTRY